MMDLLECVDADLADKITPALITKHPNTYTFTKSAAEHLVRKESKGLPTCIVRPSIITSA